MRELKNILEWSGEIKHDFYLKKENKYGAGRWSSYNI